jgi:hypothetical protein
MKPLTWLIGLAIAALIFGPEAIQRQANHERWQAAVKEAARYGVDADTFAAACDDGEDGIAFDTDAAWIAGKCWEIRHPSKASDRIKLVPESTEIPQQGQASRRAPDASGNVSFSVPGDDKAKAAPAPACRPRARAAALWPVPRLAGSQSGCRC